MEGYIKLSRKFFSNDMWNEARTFSSCEAWLDLIQSARFEATPRMESIGGREVSYTRGQYPASIRFLSKRWHWTERRVRTFLAYLKRENMITLSQDQGMNIITLVKYNEYNGDPTDTPSDTATDTGSDTNIIQEIKELRLQVTQLLTQVVTQQVAQLSENISRNNINDTAISQKINELQQKVTHYVIDGKTMHTSDTASDTTNDTDIAQIINDLQVQVTQLMTQQVTQSKINNNIKETTTNVVAKKDAAKAATLSRKEAFYQSLIPFVGLYPKEMIRAFFDYWSEQNKSGTKMRFELEKTWELSRRLKTWEKKEYQYGNRNHTITSTTSTKTRPEGLNTGSESLEEWINGIPVGQ